MFEDVWSSLSLTIHSFASLATCIQGLDSLLPALRYSGSQGSPAHGHSTILYFGQRYLGSVTHPPTLYICPSAQGMSCAPMPSAAFLPPCLFSTVLSTRSWWHPAVSWDCYSGQTFLHLFVNSLASGNLSQTIFSFTLSNHTIFLSVFSPLSFFFSLPLL